MAVIQRLSKSLQIREGEEQLVVLFWLYSFFLGLALVFTLTAGNALFISQLGSQSLPYVYLAGAVIGPFTGVMYMKGEKHLTFRQLLWVNTAICFLAFVMLRIAFVVADLRIASTALLIFYEVLWALSNFAFWGFASRLFNIRQAKRLYGLVGSGEVLAGIVGGFSVPVMLKWMATQDLLVCCAGAIAAAFVVVGIILRRHAADLASSSVESEDSSPVPGTTGYVRLLAIITAAYFFTYNVVDKVFYDQTQERFADPAQLASFLGIFFGIVEASKYVSRVLVTGRFLGAYGARSGLVALPIVVTSVTLLALATGMVRTLAEAFFWLICATKLLERVLRFALDRPSILVFYQPLPSTQRGSAQAISEGVAGPIAGGIAGLALLSVDRLGLNEQWSLIMLLPILGGWIWTGRRLGHRYVDLLSAVLERSRTKRRQRQAEPSDRDVLHHHLASPCAATVVLAAELLEEMDSDALAAETPRLLEHPDANVRRHAIQQCHRLQLTNSNAAIRNLLASDPVDFVRGAAARTLASTVEPTELSSIRDLLEHQPSELRVGAAVGLLQRSDHEWVSDTCRVVMEMARSADVSERKAAARIIEAAGYQPLSRLLERLLDDPHVDVRNAALSAAGRCHRSSFWPLVVKNLSRPESQWAATQCLLAAGERAIPTWKAAFYDANQPVETLVMMVSMLDATPATAATDVLVELLQHKNATVRHEALAALTKRRSQLRSSLREPMQKILDEELRRGAWVLQSHVEIAAPGKFDLLTTALESEFKRVQQRIIWILTLIESTDEMSVARSRFIGGSKSERAMALELIENLLPAALKGHAFSMLEQSSIGIAAERMGQKPVITEGVLEKRLEQLIDRSSTDVAACWTRTCAIYAMVGMSSPELVKATLSALKSRDPMTRETAVWALAIVAPEELSPLPKALAYERDTLVLAALDRFTGVTEENKMLTLDRVLFLKSVSVFTDTSHEALARFARKLEEVSLAAGETLFQQGDRENSLYVVTAGKLRLHTDKRTLGTRSERELVGELEALDPAPRELSATAIEQSHLLRIAPTALDEITAKHPEISQALTRAVCRQLRAASRAIGSEASELSPGET